MKCCKFSIHPLTILTLFALQAGAQTSSFVSGPDLAAHKDADIPSYQLSFKPSNSTGINAGKLLIFSQPIRCTSSGQPIVNMLDIPGPTDATYDAMKSTVYLLSEKASHAFPVSAANDLTHVHFITMDGDDSKIVLVVSAIRRDSSAPQSPSATASGSGFADTPEDFSKYRNFAIEFSLDGTYKGLTELGVPFHLQDLMLLPSGEFLVLGYDEVNSVVRLSLLKSDGDLAGSVSPSQEVVANPDLNSAQTGTLEERTTAFMHSGFGLWRFARARGKALLYEPGTKSPILEVGAGGVTREVTLAAPEGFTIQGVVAANDRWIVRYQRGGEPSSGTTTTNPEYALYQVDPSDGSLQSRFDMQDMWVSGLACEQDGRFVAFKAGTDAKVMLFTADLPR